jgi:hypothetical protein
MSFPSSKLSTVSFWNSFNSFTPNVFINKEAIFSVFTLNRTSDNRCVLIGLNNWRWWSRNQWNRLMNDAWGRGNLYESTHGWWSEERSEKLWVSDDDFNLDTKNKICSKKFPVHELRVIIKDTTLRVTQPLH